MAGEICAHYLRRNGVPNIGNKNCARKILEKAAPQSVYESLE